MWAAFLCWLKDNQIGDLTGVAGIIISLVGFGVTLIKVVRSREAAERAAAAAKEARESIRLFDTVVDFTAAITVLEEIKRAHRQAAWSSLPDRYASIRKLLIQLRASNPDLSDDDATAIQVAIVNLATMEGTVERALESPAALKSAKFNSQLSENIDSLVDILTKLKSTRAS